MTPTAMAETHLWDALASMLAYPREAARPGRDQSATDAEVPAAVGDALARFEAGIAALDLAARQERYIEAFDFDPDCALDVGWHLYGDSHERGAFMAALADDLARAGVVRSAELPDHLSHVLALIGREEPQRAGMLAALIEPAVRQVRRSLASRNSPYGALIDAVCAALESVRGRDRSARR